MKKRLNLSEFSKKNWCNDMYINLNTKKVYKVFKNNISLVKNIYTLKEIFSHLIKNSKKYGINKSQTLDLIFKDDQLNFNIL